MSHREREDVIKSIMGLYFVSSRQLNAYYPREAPTLNQLKPIISTMKKELINLGAYGDVKPTQCLDTDYYLHRP